MKKIDALIAAAIGELIAVYFYFLLGSAKNAQTGDFSLPDQFRSWLWILLFIFPVVSPLCLWIASLIGKKYLAVYQLAKFLLIGALATIFDLGILGIFIKATGIAAGNGYMAFKATSFIISTIIKYIPDKYWAFKKKETIGIKKEFFQFFTVTLTGLVINLSAAWLIVEIIGPQFNLDKETWGSIGGMGATIITFAWNFIGYKFIVFKK